MAYELIIPNPVINDIEPLGTKEKFWYWDGPSKYLFKYSRENTGEHWSEKCAAELCHLLGIPHATYDLALVGGRFGIITPNMIPENFRMVMGNEVLHSKTTGYPEPLQFEEKAVRVREHTVTRVLGCLDNESIQLPSSDYDLKELNAADVFCGYLMLDALISNQDRHHENWAIMLCNETGALFLCPTYDHAASLGREMLDAERQERLTTKDRNRQIPFFVSKARSQLFKAKIDTKPLSTIDAFLHAVADRKPARQHWISKLRDLSEESITEIFHQVPPECISDCARDFAIQMVMENRRRLLEYDNN